MDINLNLYKAFTLPNGNILLKLKKDIDTTPYNLVLTDASFYRACKKNIGKINIYEPTNLTAQLLKIIIDETTKIKSMDNFIERVRWIQQNLTTTEIGQENVDYVNKLKKNIDSYLNETVEKKLKYTKVDPYVTSVRKKIKTSTLAYLFANIIAKTSENYLTFGEEFFLLKLLNQYYPNIKWDYTQIYIIETKDDIDMCEEIGGRHYELVQRLCNGDKKAFNGKEIEFFPSSFENSKFSISEEIFRHIQYDLYNDEDNYEDYDPASINY